MILITVVSLFFSCIVSITLEYILLPDHTPLHCRFQFVI